MNIFITGCTGFVGGELLVTLSKHYAIDKIYCLVRANDMDDAYARLDHVFNYHHDFFDRSRIFPVIGNLFEEDLTSKLTNNFLLKEVDVIIHSAANTSFSRIYDDLVEKTNIEGLKKILTWARQLPNLRTFLYIGTATICGKDIIDRLILEDESPNPGVHHVVKYTYTKMRGEMLLHEYLPENKILIVRPSIIMGDSRDRNPRSPVILWALAAIDLLRLVPANPHTRIDIIPVDYVAQSILKLLFVNRKHNVYHVSSGESSYTTAYKVTKVISEYFPERPEYRFVDKALLSQMKLWAKNSLKPDSDLQNYSDYLRYWEKSLGSPQYLRIILAGLVPYFDFMELGHVFDNSRLLADTGMPPSVPAHDYIYHSLNYLSRIDVFEGAKDP